MHTLGVKFVKRIIGIPGDKVEIKDTKFDKWEKIKAKAFDFRL